jgi:hypothetical protein
MVKLARVSRASFYRFNEDAKPDPDMDLRDAIQRIALEWPSYGRPRITAELRRRGCLCHCIHSLRCCDLRRVLTWQRRAQIHGYQLRYMEDPMKALC